MDLDPEGIFRDDSDSDDEFYRVQFHVWSIFFLLTVPFVNNFGCWLPQEKHRLEMLETLDNHPPFEGLKCKIAMCKVHLRMFWSSFGTFLRFEKSIRMYTCLSHVMVYVKTSLLCYAPCKNFKISFYSWISGKRIFLAAVVYWYRSTTSTAPSFRALLFLENSKSRPLLTLKNEKGIVRIIIEAANYPLLFS